MKIETEIKVGDTVYFVDRKSLPSKVNCSFCGGKGEITVLDASRCPHTVKCPVCHGEGRDKQKKYFYVVVESKVTSIHIDIDELDKEIWYRDDKNDWEFQDGACKFFKTRKEAQDHADKLNKKNGCEYKIQKGEKQ